MFPHNQVNRYHYIVHNTYNVFFLIFSDANRPERPAEKITLAEGFCCTHILCVQAYSSRGEVSPRARTNKWISRTPLSLAVGFLSILLTTPSTSFHQLGGRKILGYIKGSSRWAYIYQYVIRVVLPSASHSC